MGYIKLSSIPSMRNQ